MTMPTFDFRSDAARTFGLRVLFILICALALSSTVLVICGLSWAIAWSWNASILLALRGEPITTAGGTGLLFLLLLVALVSSLSRRLLNERRTHE